MNRWLLRFALAFRPLWQRMGVNTTHLGAILHTKLLMDSRRHTAFHLHGQQENKPAKKQDLLATFFFFLFGLMFMFMLIPFTHTSTGLTLYFFVWMVLLSMTLITDFTEVLIDVRDNYILLPRPVDDRTLTIARLIHIGLYLSRMVVAFTLPAIVYMFFWRGLFPGLLFLVQVLLSVALVIFLVNMTYLLILRFTSARRFREIINYFQIAFTVLILAGYYLLPRVVDFSAIKTLHVVMDPIAYLLPPAWIGSMWDLLLEGSTQWPVPFLAALAVTSPVICIYLVVRFLARDFSRKMMGMSEGSTRERNDKDEKPGAIWLPKLSQKLCPDKLEAAAFTFTWRLSGRSRDFKLRTYPSFAMAPFIFIYFAMGSEGSVAERWAEVKAGDLYVMLLYFCLIALSGPINVAGFSDRFRASWLFYATPVTSPGYLLSGMFKAVTVRYFLPFYFIISGFALYVWGLKVIDDLLFGLANLLFIGVLTAYLTARRLPFSVSWKDQQKGRNLAAGIGMLIFATVLGVLHYFVLIYAPAWLIPALTPLPLLAFFYFLRQYQQLGWKAVVI